MPDLHTKSWKSGTLDLRGHNTDWGGDGEASGTWMPMVILQGNCFKNVSRKVPSSAKLFLSGGELTNHKTFY